jgi:hypothetical protein
MLSVSEDSAFYVRDDETLFSFKDDLRYCLDLGLLKKDGGLRPANPIYADAIVRFLNENIQDLLPKAIIGKWMDGKNMDMTGLLKEFQQFLANSSKKCLARLDCKEAGPHLSLTAFIQKAVDGAAAVFNEFVDGTGYAYIVVQYAGRNHIIELQIKDDQKSFEESWERLAGYMDRLSTAEGWLAVFDRKSKKSWTEKICWKTSTTPTGQTIHTVGC